MADGPELRVKFTCSGCDHLRTEDWEEECENDEIDRGTTARCGATTTDPPSLIGAYWHSGRPTPEWCPKLPKRVRHVKRGTTYQLLGIAEVQVSANFPDPLAGCVEGDRLAVYRGDDGKLWARPEDEFNDGRFERLEP